MSWQKILAQGYSSSQELLIFLNLPPALGDLKAENQFKTRVPKGFVKRMSKGNPRDPLLLQVLAQDLENTPSAGYVDDPLEEKKTNITQGLIHKYHGRVLLTLTGACAINCRYCFRRHFPYHENNPGRKGWKTVLDYIKNDSSIKEVILSGGDPLLASDSTLEYFISALEKISSIKTLRFHTRIPVVLPERIDEAFLKLLSTVSLRKVMVLHINHPQEIDDEVKKVCQLLKKAGCHLLCQSVLLKGVNDCPIILAELSEKIFDCGVLPYYLHVLDKVTGAAHFDLSMTEIYEIYQKLQQRLPGYLLPRLAKEEAGKRSKTLL